MAQDGMMESLEQKVRQVEAEETPEAATEDTPVVSPAAATNLLSGPPLAGAQRRSLVQNVGQNFGNRQVQRMINTLRRSASSGPEGGPLENEISDRIQSERSSGQPLDTGIRREVESSLGQDLSQVRVHTGSSSAELNRELGAKAFTTGRDIFFGEGQSPSDKELLTHEATHTIQQGFSETPPASVGAADTVHEQAADAAAHSTGSAGGVQREAEEDELAMKRDASLQREAEEDELAMKRDDSIQREAEEDELAMKRDDSIQREAEEDELAMKRDDSIQREAEEDELAMKRDETLQREAEEDELAMKRDETVQREGEEDELA